MSKSPCPIHRPISSVFTNIIRLSSVSPHQDGGLDSISASSHEPILPPLVARIADCAQTTMHVPKLQSGYSTNYATIANDQGSGPIVLHHTSASRRSCQENTEKSGCTYRRSWYVCPSSDIYVQPFTAKSAGLFFATATALILYFQYEKARMERKRIVEMSKGYGKPKVGGPFHLRDLDGNEFTEKSLLGKYTLVCPNTCIYFGIALTLYQIYFGFSHCPDICPDELDKMSAAIDIVQSKEPNSLRSVFITCDPARDTPAVLRSYLAEFHPSLLGLTGTWEEVKNVCKQYRVYFSTPPDLKPGEEDYLVDHSIYFYVMDPEGDFVECIGRQDTPESAAAIVLEHIKDWKLEKKPIDTTPLPYLNVAPPPAAAGLAGNSGRTAIAA